MNLNLNRQPDVRNSIVVNVKITAERRHSKSSQYADLERRKGGGRGFHCVLHPNLPPPICGNSKLELVDEITSFFRQNHDCADNVKVYTDMRNVNEHMFIIKISPRESQNKRRVGCDWMKRLITASLVLNCTPSTWQGLTPKLPLWDLPPKVSRCPDTETQALKTPKPQQHVDRQSTSTKIERR